VVENGLGPIVEEISVSPSVVRKIVEGTIDEAWVRALAEVEKRSKALDIKTKEHRNIKGVRDLKPLLENLVNKVRFTWVFHAEMLIFVSGSRKDQGLFSGPNQSITFTEYQCSDHTATAFH